MFSTLSSSRYQHVQSLKDHQSTGPSSPGELTRRLLFLFKSRRTRKRSEPVPQEPSATRDGGLVRAYSGITYPEVEKPLCVDSSDSLLSHNYSTNDAGLSVPSTFADQASARSFSFIHKLKVELTSFARSGERSSQKRIQGTFNDPNRHGKRQCQQGRHPGDGAGDKGGGEDRKGGQKPDGERYPALNRNNSVKMLFECPFYKHDPVRYEKCRGIRLSRVSDVPGHIMRQHLLVEVRLQPGPEADEADENNVENVSYCNKAKDIVFYCPRCRMEFFGPGADARRDSHLEHGLCRTANIAQTGVLLPGEYKALKPLLGSDDCAKWNRIWAQLFPLSVEILPTSPYVETLVPRPQATLELRRVLGSYKAGLPLANEDMDYLVTSALDRIYTQFDGSSIGAPDPVSLPTETDSPFSAGVNHFPETKNGFYPQVFDALWTTANEVTDLAHSNVAFNLTSGTSICMPSQDDLDVFGPTVY